MSQVIPAFGARLRSCRQSAGMSQQDLAERSGLSVRAVSDLERGRTRFPYQDSLARLADALGLRGPARTEFIAAAGRRVGRAEAAKAAGGPGETVMRDVVIDTPIRRPCSRGVRRRRGFSGRALLDDRELPGCSSATVVTPACTWFLWASGRSPISRDVHPGACGDIERTS
jgi:transcriptional regulator with XRE-family HTH domain